MSLKSNTQTLHERMSVIDKLLRTRVKETEVIAAQIDRSEDVERAAVSRLAAHAGYLPEIIAYLGRQKAVAGLQAYIRVQKQDPALNLDTELQNAIDKAQALKDLIDANWPDDPAKRSERLPARDLGILRTRIADLVTAAG